MVVRARRVPERPEHVSQRRLDVRAQPNGMLLVGEPSRLLQRGARRLQVAARDLHRARRHHQTLDLVRRVGDRAVRPPVVRRRPLEPDIGQLPLVKIGQGRGIPSHRDDSVQRHPGLLEQLDGTFVGGGGARRVTFMPTYPCDVGEHHAGAARVIAVEEEVVSLLVERLSRSVLAKVGKEIAEHAQDPAFAEAVAGGPVMLQRVVHVIQRLGYAVDQVEAHRQGVVRLGQGQGIARTSGFGQRVQGIR